MSDAGMRMYRHGVWLGCLLMCLQFELGFSPTIPPVDRCAGATGFRMLASTTVSHNYRVDDIPAMDAPKDGNPGSPVTHNLRHS